MDKLNVARIAMSLLLSTAAAGLVLAEEDDSLQPRALKPCYVVLATDISSSMNYSDPLVEKREGHKLAARDDAQLTFVSMLWGRHYRNYVGTLQFSLQVDRSCPSAADSGSTPLLPWHEYRCDPATAQRMVRSVEPAEKQGTNLAVAMDWAFERVRAARRKAEPYKAPDQRGPAVLILLSDGDPDNAPREFNARQGPVLNAAKRLAAANIRVCPIIINRASAHSSRQPETLSTPEKAAEWLMDEIARLTGGGGQAYRLTSAKSLDDAFNSILDEVAGPASAPSEGGSFAVSKYHSVVLLGGPLLKSIDVNAAAGQPAAQLSVRPGTDATTGIDRELLPLIEGAIVKLSRPADPDRVDAYWQGEWVLRLKDAQGRFRGWVELVPDFLAAVSLEPDRPWLAHERGQIRAKLVPRPDLPGMHPGQVPDLQDPALGFRIEYVPVQGGEPESIAIDWDAREGNTLISKHFSFDRPGRYKVALRCTDKVGDKQVVVAEAVKEVEVEPLDLAFQLVTDARGGARWAYPPEPGAKPGQFREGDEVRAELEVSDEVLDASIRLDRTGLERRFEKVAAGRYVTSPFTAPHGARHLDMNMDVTVASRGVERPVSLPLTIPLGEPVEAEVDFADWRDELWLSEKHQQEVRIRLSPVTADEHEYFAQWLPEKLRGARAHMPHRRVHEQPGISCVANKDARFADNAIQASYTLTSTSPLTQTGECQIDLGLVLPGTDARKTYRVIDRRRQVCSGGGLLREGKTWWGWGDLTV